MPTPQKDETQSEFISRCVPIVLDDGTAQDNKQAVAICYSIWRQSKKKGADDMRQWFTMKKVVPDPEEDDDAAEKEKKRKKKDVPLPAEDKNGGADPDEDEDEDEPKKATAEIMIYDEIGRSFWGEETVSAKAFLQGLTDLGDDVGDITLHINSPGGDVFDGLSIHNALKNHPATVTAHIDGIAASIASYIAMAADKIVMPENAFMLLHQASGLVMGTSDDMRSVADDLERIDKAITATYAARSGQSQAKVKALLREDRLMDAAEAKKLGYADVVGPNVKMAASFSLRLLPKAAADKFRAVAEIAGDPSASPVREEPVASPATPTSSVSHEPTGEVVSLKTAKKQGVAEHKAYVDDITDLCVLANMADRVGAYVRASTPVEQVRKELLAARAETQPIMPHHPLIEPKPAASMWGKITDKLNARNKKGA